MIDYYELLGIKENAAKEEIKLAYRNMVKKYHPDVNKSPEAQQIIRSLNEAKDTLLDENKRKTYDEALNEIKYSKQFSQNKNATYKAKNQKYKTKYQAGYLTKWQLFIHYVKTVKDQVFIKIIKTILILLNHIVFLALRGLLSLLLFIIDLFDNVIDYIAGIGIFLAIASIFFLSEQTTPNLISFMPANWEMFSYLMLTSFLILFLKNSLMTKSVNIYSLIQNTEDRLFIYILRK